MNKIKENLTINEVKIGDDNTLNQRKAYKQPKLTSYGDISELVLMNAGVGPDGGMIGALTFST